MVSIITIVYNGEKSIEKTIQSVLNQTYPDIEYIIIDGGSTDNTIKIIKKYETRIAYWSSEKDKGISDAFNKGIRKASGQIIGLINADDWFEPDAVENVVRNIGSNDIFYGNLLFWEKGNKAYLQKGNHHHLINEMSINHPTVFIKRSCYEKQGVFDESFKCAMDYDLLLRMMTGGSSFVYADKLIANMRLEGISDKKWFLGCQETLSIKNKYLPNRKWKNKLYFYKHVAAIAVSKFLKKAGMQGIIKFYRIRFAMLKKEYT